MPRGGGRGTVCRRRDAEIRDQQGQPRTRQRRRLMKTARVDCRGGCLDGELLDIRDEPDAVHPDRDGDYRRIGPNYLAVFVPEGASVDRWMKGLGRVRSCTCG